MKIKKTVRKVLDYSDDKYGINDDDVHDLLMEVRALWRHVTREADFEDDKIKTIQRKFYDAGRRSPPWEPTSSRVPGRPQDGADGNRRKRWLFDRGHKYYASKVDATLVEVKFFFQALSMDGAPKLPDERLETAFGWMMEHPVAPGEYRDPIQKIPINFSEFLDDPTTIESGHLVPLDRGGRHVPDNTFLMLHRSNQMQGNRTVDELLEAMRDIVDRHEREERQDALAP
jgi:hypothetical protein